MFRLPACQWLWPPRPVTGDVTRNHLPTGPAGDERTTRWLKRRRRRRGDLRACMPGRRWPVVSKWHRVKSSRRSGLQAARGTRHDSGSPLVDQLATTGWVRGAWGGLTPTDVHPRRPAGGFQIAVLSALAADDQLVPRPMLDPKRNGMGRPQLRGRAADVALGRSGAVALVAQRQPSGRRPAPQSGLQLEFSPHAVRRVQAAAPRAAQKTLRACSAVAIRALA